LREASGGKLLAAGAVRYALQAARRSLCANHTQMKKDHFYVHH
jgi:hypothetical protein